MSEPLRLEAVQQTLLVVLRSRIDAEAPAAVDPFLNRLLALPEPEMRARSVTAQLRRVEAHLGLALLLGLVDRSLNQDDRARAILLDLSTGQPLAEALGYEASRALYQLAKDRSLDRVANLFLSAEDMGSKRGVGRGGADNEKLPDESLGWRKHLAKGRDRLKLDRLLFDRNPAVIRLLLDNPLLIERDAVRIAAMRPTKAACLETIFRHPKWIRRYRVKVALASNPYCPIDIALACVPHLMAEQLRYIATTQRLHGTVRQTAREILDRRQLAVDPGPPGVHHLSDEKRMLRELEGGLSDGDLDLAAIAQQLKNWMA